MVSDKVIRGCSIALLYALARLLKFVSGLKLTLALALALLSSYVLTMLERQLIRSIQLMLTSKSNTLDFNPDKYWLRHIKSDIRNCHYMTGHCIYYARGRVLHDETLLMIGT